MNYFLRIPLNTSAEQMARLQALQAAFAEVCNALAPVVQQTRCWNRVTLHHLTYHGLRERFPRIGSQMICNAIYSVSRTCRLMLQNPASPWNITKNPDAPIPLLKFLPNAPVYFDRHTLSIKEDRLSMYTLDGRVRFQLDLKPEDRAHFHQSKLREIILSCAPPGYQLMFQFSLNDDDEAADSHENHAREAGSEFPEYVVVLPEESPATGASVLDSLPKNASDTRNPVSREPR